METRPAVQRPVDPVMVDLGDGVPRALRYSMGTMKRVKMLLGRSVLTPGVLQEIGLEDSLPGLIFEGLVDKSDITLDAVCEIIDMRNIGTITEQMTLAMGGKTNTEKNE